MPENYDGHLRMHDSFPGVDSGTEATPTLPPNGLEGPIKIKKPRPPKPGPSTPVPANEYP